MHTLVLGPMHTTLRAARERRGWDQLTLAAKSGVGQSDISRIEAGHTKNPTITTVRKLEKALRLRPGTLLFGVVDEPEAKAS